MVGNNGISVIDKMNEFCDENIPLISVIVPVYRAEDYLEQCIRSICSQTYTNLDIILVDDGSPDKCPQICDDFAKLDGRIRVIHKTNGGMAEARNVGTIQALGEYILYVDSDDIIHIDMIKRMYCYMIKSCAQAAICNYCAFESEVELLNCKFQEIIQRYNGVEAAREMLYQRIENTPWGKLLPRTVCEQFPFPTGRLYEDLFVMYKMLYCCNNIIFLDQPLYFYRLNNPNSVMHRTFSSKTFDLIDAGDEIVNFAIANDQTLLAAAKARRFSAYSQVLRWIPNSDKEHQKRQMEIWNEIKKYRWDMIFDRNARMKNRLAALCTLLGRKTFKLIANRVSR